MTEQQETQLLATLEDVALELKRIREVLERRQEPEPKNPFDVCGIKPVGDDAERARDARFDGTTEEVAEANAAPHQGLERASSGTAFGPKAGEVISSSEPQVHKDCIVNPSTGDGVVGRSGGL